MKQTIDIEQNVSQNLRLLPKEKQQEVLDFVQFLIHKLQQDLTAAQLTEFFVLDGEDYLIEKFYTRSHDAFLKGYAPEDEGLYDDY